MDSSSKKRPLQRNSDSEPSTDEDIGGDRSKRRGDGINRTQTVAEKTKHHIDKLMKRIDKPIVLPPKRSDIQPREPKDFIRNVQGSSAGAGSGEFHVYRALRRKEFARVKYMEQKAKEEIVAKEYDEKISSIKAAEEAKAAKKREKRNKRKKKGGKDAKKKDAQSDSADKNNDGDGDDGDDESDDNNNVDDEQKKEPATET